MDPVCNTTEVQTQDSLLKCCMITFFLSLNIRFFVLLLFYSCCCLTVYLWRVSRCDNYTPHIVARSCVLAMCPFIYVLSCLSCSVSACVLGVFFSGYTFWSSRHRNFILWKVLTLSKSCLSTNVITFVILNCLIICFFSRPFINWLLSRPLSYFKTISAKCELTPFKAISLYHTQPNMNCLLTRPFHFVIVNCLIIRFFQDDLYTDFFQLGSWNLHS